MTTLPTPGEWSSLPITAREGGSALILGGGAKSIGPYAVGLAAANGASTVDHGDLERRAIAESFGARGHPVNRE